MNLYWLQSGGGIDDKIIHKVFDPYFTTKHQSQGTGLGLYMVRNLIIDGLNGTIEVINTNFDNTEIKGAMFKIVLN
jgi:signal transduction histidine kinase